MKIENKSKIVSEKDIQEIEKRLNPENEVLTEINLRVGEPDVRELDQKQFQQVVYRFMNDTMTILNIMAQAVVDINLIALEGLSHNKKERVARLLDGRGKPDRSEPKNDAENKSTNN